MASCCNFAQRGGRPTEPAKDQGLVPVSRVFFFFLLACRINFQALVVVVVLSRLQQVAICVCFDIVFILVDCALHFA